MAFFCHFDLCFAHANDIGDFIAIAIVIYVEASRQKETHREVHNRFTPKVPSVALTEFKSQD